MLSHEVTIFQLQVQTLIFIEILCLFGISKAVKSILIPSWTHIGKESLIEIHAILFFQGFKFLIKRIMSLFMFGATNALKCFYLAVVLTDILKLLRLRKENIWMQILRNGFAALW